jgi:NCS1 family nucleobase:cation symporter-1
MQDDRKTETPADTPGHPHHHHLPHIGGEHLIMHQPPAEALAIPGMPSISERLYNQDLAPTKRAGRRWSAYNIFTLWANDVHSLGNYVFAIGLFALGLGAWQILLSFLLGAVLLFLLLSLSGFMGEKLGVPFPVMSRIAFGIHGAQIAAIARGGVAIVWSVSRPTWPAWCCASCSSPSRRAWRPGTKTPSSVCPPSAGSPSSSCG